MKDFAKVRVNMMPVIDFDELENEFEIPKEQYAFYNRADQYDGYFGFGTDIDDLYYYEQKIGEYLDKMRDYPDRDWSEYIEHLQNDLELIKTLREAGYDDGVIIYVWC